MPPRSAISLDTPTSLCPGPRSEVAAVLWESAALLATLARGEPGRVGAAALAPTRPSGRQMLQPERAAFDQNEDAQSDQDDREEHMLPPLQDFGDRPTGSDKLCEEHQNRDEG